MIRRASALLSAVLSVVVLSACATNREVSSTTSTSPGASSTTTLIDGTAPSLALPEDSVRSDGGGAPRSPGYWLVWNTCTEGNQSDVAIANGGAIEGWYLMDDILTHPGVSVGDYVIETCAQGAYVLAAENGSGESLTTDFAYLVASRLLAAELNLNVGAESCPAIEEVVIAGHVLLSMLEFDGSDPFLPPGSNEEERASAQGIIDLLERYNTGDLCQ